MNSKLLKTKISSCILLCSVFLTAVVFLNGCKTTSMETAERDTLTSNIGVYPAPPAGIVRARVGVPQFQVENAQIASGGEIESLAADQLTTLAVQTGRFRVVERAQLNQLLAEQGLEGIVRPEELAASGRVRGVDYLLIGKVTNFRVKAEGARKGFNVGALSGFVGGLGADTPLGLASTFDFHSNRSKFKVECGVDLRLADAETGEVVVAHFGEFARTDTVGSMGIGFAGWFDESSAELSLDSDNQGKILRLVLDDTIRKMLPKVDEFLMSHRSALQAKISSVSAPGSSPNGTAVTSESTNSIVSTAGQAAPKFCSSCGAQLEPGARFCGNCGGKHSPARTVQTSSAITGGQSIASPAPKQAVAQQQMVAFCSRCGAKVGSTDKFCAKCGAKVRITGSESTREKVAGNHENVPAPIVFADEEP